MISLNLARLRSAARDPLLTLDAVSPVRQQSNPQRSTANVTMVEGTSMTAVIESDSGADYAECPVADPFGGGHHLVLSEQSHVAIDGVHRWRQRPERDVPDG
jgi:hypothetical protein